MIAAKAWLSRKGSRAMTLTVTAYCPCGLCCNWERKWLLWPVIAGGPLRGAPKKVGYCADGTKAQVSTIAADTSLFPFGTLMYVPGYGWGEVRDVGSDIKGTHIDVYFRTHEEAAAWGVRRLKVTVYK
jgi:3D (Asp-Asp-Asp) domain-containing protein